MRTSFPITFQDPATVIAYNLFSVHHDVFFFIIIILSLVYWSLYKIIKDFNWHISIKQSGILKEILNNRFFLILESQIIFLWFKLFKFTLNKYINFLLKLEKYLFVFQIDEPSEYDKKRLKYKKIISWFLIGGIVKGFSFPKWYLKDFSNLATNWEKSLRDRNASYFLYNYTSNSRFYHDIKDDFLATQRFKHSTKLEFIFAFFPTFIISLILVPSLYLLYSFDEDLEPIFTIKVVGHQWYWSYEWNEIIYLNSLNKHEKLASHIFSLWSKKNIDDQYRYINNKISKNLTDLNIQIDSDYSFLKTNSLALKYKDEFDSVMLQRRHLPKFEPRLLTTDNFLYIPAKTTLRFVITSEDVLHSWAIPEFGVKVDAVPGRLNEVIINVEKPGRYFGQCSELCGVAHGFMPIAIEVLPWEKFIDKIMLNANEKIK